MQIPSALKKPDEARSDEEMRAEYDFSDGVRGKYAARYAEGSNIVVVAPDLVEQFPTSRSVNDALRKLVKQRQS